MIVLILALIWIALGIFGFYLEIKEERYTESEAEYLVGELWSCIALGIFSFLYMVHPLQKLIKFIIRIAQDRSEKRGSRRE